MPRINASCSQSVIQQCADICPQDCIDTKNKTIDLGRCTFCGQCEVQSKGEFVLFSENFELGAASREHLITGGSLPALAEHSKQHFKKLFGRSLQLRQVSAVGCNSCEADTNVLNTPFFDLSRFGIDFVASPRHADGIHVTGPISRRITSYNVCYTKLLRRLMRHFWTICSTTVIWMTTNGSRYPKVRNLPCKTEPDRWV